MTEFLKGICDGAIRGKKETFNPIFLYGDPEKVRAVMDVIVWGWGNEYWEEPLYRTDGTAFLREIFHAMKTGDRDSFEDSLPGHGLLAFEGIESLSGKEHAQQMFYGMFDAIYESGGQILIGSIFPPALLGGLSDRIRTQISGGIVCCVDEEDVRSSNEELVDFGFLKTRNVSPTEQRHKRIHTIFKPKNGPRIGIWADSWKELAEMIRQMNSKGPRIDRRFKWPASCNESEDDS